MNKILRVLCLLGTLAPLLAGASDRKLIISCTNLANADIYNCYRGSSQSNTASGHIESTTYVSTNSTAVNSFSYFNKSVGFLHDYSPGSMRRVDQTLKTTYTSDSSSPLILPGDLQFQIDVGEPYPSPYFMQTYTGTRVYDELTIVQVTGSPTTTNSYRLIYTNDPSGPSPLRPWRGEDSSLAMSSNSSTNGGWIYNDSSVDDSSFTGSFLLQVTYNGPQGTSAFIDWLISPVQIFTPPPYPATQLNTMLTPGNTMSAPSGQNPVEEITFSSWYL